MIELKLNESNELKFSLDVTGAPTEVSEVRLTFNEKNKKISYVGKLEGNIVTVLLDSLDVLGAGKHQYDLEVIIGNQYFKPLTDYVTIKEDIKIKSSVIEAISAPSIKVALTEVEKKLKDKPTEDKVVKKEVKASKLADFFTHLSEDKKKCKKCKQSFKTDDEDQVLCDDCTDNKRTKSSVYP